MPNYDFVEESGIVIVDTSTTLEEVKQEYRDAFDNQNLVVDSGPLYVLIEAEAQQRDKVAKNNAEVANQINPNIAGGVFLDSVLSLTDGQRDPGEKTTVTATLGGVAGTVVPAGSAAQSDSNDRFISTGEAIIGVGGTIDIEFQADNDGPIALGANELTQILDSVLGWETIDNSSVGLTGRFEQSDVNARVSRKASLALQGISLSEAIFSNLIAVDNVSSISFRENVTNAVAVIDGVTMPPHSVYVCVDGGLDSDVADALLRTKTGGAQWHNGESASPVTEDVIDPISGQTYQVKFDRPADVPIKTKFTISVGSFVGDASQAVKDAVIAYANGEIEGEAGFIVGGDVSPFELAGAVTVTNPSILVREVLVTTVSDNNLQPVTIDIDLFSEASIVEGNIAVTII